VWLRLPPSRPGRACRYAGVLLLLPLAAWAADPLQLAPSAPDRPWVIPPSIFTSGRADGSGDAVQQGSRVLIDRNHRYNLAELIDLAQRSNPQTREAWEQARQTALAVGLVDSSYMPQLSIQAIGGFQRTPFPTPQSPLNPKGFFVLDTHEFIPGLALKWLLFDFGRRDGLDRAARANSFVANVAFTGVHQKLIFTVSRAYFVLGGLRGRVSAAQQALKTAEIVQNATDSRRKQGLVTVVAVAQAQRQMAQARLSLTKAAGEERTAYANLLASIGIARDSPLQVADSSEQPLPAEPADGIDVFVRDALANRPDVIVALGKIEAAKGALDMARADYYPTLSVMGQLFQNMGSLSTDGGHYSNINKPGGNILFTLSIPLFDGGARNARTSIARSQVAAASEKLDQVRDAATAQVVGAYNDLKTSSAAYSAASALLNAAQTAYDAALEAFLHGVGTYTDLANEQTFLAQANAEKEDAHANVFTAAAALAFATGTVRTE
jgi:outer membrane protein